MYMYDPNWKPLVFFLYSKCYLIFVPYFWNKMILFARENIIIFIPVFKTISNLKISIKYIYTFYFLIKKSHFEKTKDIYIYIYIYIYIHIYLIYIVNVATFLQTGVSISESLFSPLSRQTRWSGLVTHYTPRYWGRVFGLGHESQL